MCLRVCLSIVLTLAALSSSAGKIGGKTLSLHYDRPSGFSRGDGETETWVADSLDGLIHVYRFRPFHGDFAEEFRRTLFRDWVSAAYREDKWLDQPTFSPLRVNGATTAIAASFKNFNGGAPREHLRVAVLASGQVALVDISANSPNAFERNRSSFSRLLSSLHVVESDASAPRVLR